VSGEWLSEGLGRQFTKFLRLLQFKYFLAALHMANDEFAIVIGIMCAETDGLRNKNLPN
jgi:hypothetical protein